MHFDIIFTCNKFCFLFFQNLRKRKKIIAERITEILYLIFTTISNDIPEPYSFCIKGVVKQSAKIIIKPDKIKYTLDINNVLFIIITILNRDNLCKGCPEYFLGCTIWNGSGCTPRTYTGIAVRIIRIINHSCNFVILKTA